MNKVENTITIAIPFYNAELYLEDAIVSVINQTYQKWKLLLIDDGSSDSSLTIARSYELKEKRIKVFSDGKNKNLGYRLNQIPTLVDTLYLARMDADDIMHPEKIEKQIAVLEKHPEIDVLGTNAYTIDENNNVVGVRFNFGNQEEITSVSTFIHPTIIAKTEWFKKNPYDVKAERIEDLELWYRTSNTSKFKMLSTPLFFYREFNGGYYKKYKAAQKTKDYILNKYPNNIFWIKYFRNNRIKFNIYRFFNLFKLEGMLILRRNNIVFKEKHSVANLSKREL